MSPDYYATAPLQNCVDDRQSLAAALERHRRSPWLTDAQWSRTYRSLVDGCEACLEVIDRRLEAAR